MPLDRPGRARPPPTLHGWLADLHPFALFPEASLSLSLPWLGGRRRSAWLPARLPASLPASLLCPAADYFQQRRAATSEIALRVPPPNSLLLHFSKLLRPATRAGPAQEPTPYFHQLSPSSLAVTSLQPITSATTVTAASM
ncbi:hypothetical protein L1887_53360 [Cichorium endivia]|nr:hypothetical protein L1887_53360 [Cichorium endivia]